MTPTDYQQLRAFARIDGAYLGLLWMLSFACSIVGTHIRFLATMGFVLALLTPFFVVRRIGAFRDQIRKGQLSYWSGYTYSMAMFFYGALLLAITHYVYFGVISDGSLLSTILDQAKLVLLESGQYPADEVNQSIAQLRTLRPIDWALQFLSMNIIIGGLASILIAFVTRRATVADNRI